MKNEPQDYDIATSAKPDQVEKLFKKTVPVGKQYGVILVVEEDTHFEVATFRQEGDYRDGRHPSQVTFSIPEEDAKRRDFTVNGLFYDPASKKVHDFVGGIKDIKKRIIRAIGDPAERFEEDKLRLLRAVRFASTLNFKIEKKTWEALCERVEQIREVSVERVRDELVKMLTRPGAQRGFELLSESGLMKVILPEVEAMKGVQQQKDYHPEGDVFVHTGLLLKKLDKPSLVLALSALFHDVAKPTTYAIRNHKITFYEHASIGAKKTEEIMRRLHFSNDEIKAVAECVANHMKFADVQRMRSGKLKRFMVRDTFDIEMELHRIDCQSSHGMLDNYDFLKKKIKEYAQEELKPKPLINGHDLQKIGIKPGPIMKTILEDVYDLQLEDKVTTPQDALAWVRSRHLPKK